MERILIWLAALALMTTALPALAGEYDGPEGEEAEAEAEDDEEEGGITAGLIEKDKRYGEIDRFYKDVLDKDEDDEDAVDPDELDPSRAWRVENLTVEFDSFQITFVEGEFFPRQEIEGNTYGAVFIGDGRWVFHTDLELEQDEMERVLKERTLDKTFSNAFLEFAPQYLERFQQDALEASGKKKTSDEAAAYWKKRRKEVPRDFDRSIAYWHVENMELFDEINIEAKVDGLKLNMEVNTGGKGPLVYTWDAEDPEEVALWRYHTNALNVYDVSYDTICHFPRAVDRENLTRREMAYKNPNIYDVQHYDADFEIRKDPDSPQWSLNGDVTITFTPLLRDLNVVPFSLINWFTSTSVYTERLNVTAVLDEEGNTLPYIHKWHQLAVELPEPARVGESYKIRVVYGGDIIDVITQPDPEMGVSERADAAQADQALNIVNYALLNTYPWFPQNSRDIFDRYTWDWRIRLPKPMLVASSGTLVSQEEDGSDYVFTVKENVPSALASMIYGRFTLVQDDFEEGKRPHIRVYAHAGQTDSAQEILEQSHDIIGYFEELYQVPYPYPELDIAQMPYGVGFAQAPPGLVQMDGAAYLSKTLLMTVYNVRDPFIREAFLPHEIAHQWWAHVTCSLTDHDYWLMEAGAEYSAALFEEAANGEKGYARYVKYWENRRAAKNTKRTMSLWMAATGRDSRRYISTIYGRGPLLYHELRESLGYAKIVSVLRAVLAEWNGKNISTEDFQMVLEKATGMSFQDYFDRFVYRNEALGTAPEDLQ